MIQRVRPAPNQTNPGVTVATTMSYDELHRLRTQSYSDGTPTVTINYDQTAAFGVALTNTRGRKSSEQTSTPTSGILTGAVFGYDSLGRILINSQCTPQNCASGVFPLSYTYDLLGNLTSGSNGVGVTFTYNYNRVARLTSVTSSLVNASHPATLISALHYNAFGGPVSGTLGNGISESWAYTTRGWPQFFQLQSPSGGTPGTGSVAISGFVRSRYEFPPGCTMRSCAELVYDSGEVRITVDTFTAVAYYQQGSSSSSIANSLASIFNTNPSSPVTAVVSSSTVNLTSKGSGPQTNYPLSTQVVSYEGMNSFTATPSGSTLTGGSGSPTYTYSLTYAPNGNLLTANDSVNGNWSYGYDAFNRLISASKAGASYTYEYDRFGNRWHQNALAGGWGSHYSFDANNRIFASEGVTYDVAGNVRTYNDGARTWTYTYDAENRLIAVDNGATGSYVYDGGGRRVRRSSAAGTVDYLYDLGGRAITELSASGGWNRGEVYAGGRHVATYSNSTTYFAHTDWLGTERARTGLGGTTPVQTCTSLPFGDGMSCAGTSASPLHFTGKERDPESNLDYFGARFYGSALGRFGSIDPLRQSASPSLPQTWNRYTYALNNPLKYVDPDGKCSAPAGIKPGQVGICIGSFISAKRIGGVGLGDNRGPVGNDPRATFKAQVQLVVDPSKGSIESARTEAGKSSVFFQGLGRKGTATSEISTPTVDANGNTRFSVTTTATNGISEKFFEPIDLSIDLLVTPEGKVGVEGGTRDGYPSLEVFSYDSEGKVTPVLFIQETTSDALKPPKEQKIPKTGSGTPPKEACAQSGSKCPS